MDGKDRYIIALSIFIVLLILALVGGYAISSKQVATIAILNGRLGECEDKYSKALNTYNQERIVVDLPPCSKRHSVVNDTLDLIDILVDEDNIIMFDATMFVDFDDDGVDGGSVSIRFRKGDKFPIEVK